MLVADEGFPGIVVRLGRGFRWAGRDGDLLTAGGAMPLAGARRRRDAPSTLGSRVRGRDPREPRRRGEDERRCARTLDVRRDRADRGLPARRRGRTPVALRGPRRGSRTVDPISPPARSWSAPSARLASAGEEEIRARMEEAREWRRRTQPLAEPNCGSVFKNPDGDHAARLIEASGAKGLRVGGARVSEKHANFIVADPGASASDVWTLIGQVRSRVESDAGIRLETEVESDGGGPLMRTIDPHGRLARRWAIAGLAVVVRRARSRSSPHVHAAVRRRRHPARRSRRDPSCRDPRRSRACTDRSNVFHLDTAAVERRLERDPRILRATRDHIAPGPHHDRDRPSDRGGGRGRRPRSSSAPTAW